MKISIQSLKEAKYFKLSKKLEDISFIYDSDVLNLEIEFIVQLISENIFVVNGFFTVLMIKKCERCLEEFNSKINIEFNKEYEIQNNQKEIDLSCDMREEFWLNRPLVYLCKEDCRGLCSICGTNLNREDCCCKKDEVFNNNPFKKLKITNFKN